MAQKKTTGHPERNPQIHAKTCEQGIAWKLSRAFFSQ
jgi:hypothetical protein